jgi:HEPN domain-containing protein
MPPKERFPPDTPTEWINRARSDLAIAQSIIEGVYLEDLCYHAQQCAEKALKAVLLHKTGAFPYVHDLAELVHRVQLSGLAAPEMVRKAVALTEYAVEGRYPGFDEPVTAEQWKDAVDNAKVVLQWAESVLPPPAS